MKCTSWKRTGLMLIVGLVSTVQAARAADYPYKIGSGSADITGPAVGLAMWGFVREGQVTEGIHTRLRARAFVVVDAESGKRLAFVSADIGSMTNAMAREVIDELGKQFPGVYTIDNTVLSATHTHSGPGGYWHYGVDSPIGGPFYGEHFDGVVSGIVQAVVAAHESLAPGRILIGTGDVQGGGANRSAVAYDNNSPSERARYDGNTDKEMTLLRFEGADGPVGMVNWFAVHPTAMTFNNRLISGDHKGYASQRFEQIMGAPYAGAGEFVAAFAQTNCGDVTPNLNLNNTGPGENEFETTRIIGDRQLDVAVELFKTASEELTGGLDYRHVYIDLSHTTVDGKYTGSGSQTTCPSAYGYSFAAGSTEDGGGNPLFREGMTERNPMVDGLIEKTFKLPPPSDELRACQLPKAILLAPGATKPYPSQAQIASITVARIGQLVIVAGPAEFTTMAGRRIRETVAAAMGDSVKHVVLAGYANGYMGYVTTKEEYDTQQYEGGHTLFGPWTQAAYQQEFARLATSLSTGNPVADAGKSPRDMRGQVTSTPLGTEYDALPRKKAFGDVAVQPKSKYRVGDMVSAAFWSSHPQNGFRVGNAYLTVEFEGDGKWVAVANDGDWATKCHWVPDETAKNVWRMEASWDVPIGTAPGKYRLVHHGMAKPEANGSLVSYEGATKAFSVKE
jgi:neutral ceramidase